MTYPRLHAFHRRTSTYVSYSLREIINWSNSWKRNVIFNYFLWNVLARILQQLLATFVVDKRNVRIYITLLNLLLPSFGNLIYLNRVLKIDNFFASSGFQVSSMVSISCIETRWEFASCTIDRFSMFYSTIGQDYFSKILCQIFLGDSTNFKYRCHKQWIAELNIKRIKETSNLKCKGRK